VTVDDALAYAMLPAEASPRHIWANRYAPEVLRGICDPTPKWSRCRWRGGSFAALRMAWGKAQTKEGTLWPCSAEDARLLKGGGQYVSDPRLSSNSPPNKILSRA